MALQGLRPQHFSFANYVFSGSNRYFNQRTVFFSNSIVMTFAVDLKQAFGLEHDAVAVGFFLEGEWVGS